MTQKTTIRVWLAVNEEGESYADVDSAQDAADNCGGAAIRIVAINVTLDLPTIETVTVDVTVPQTNTPAQVSATHVHDVLSGDRP